MLQPTSSRGFTLMELMLAIAISAVVLTVAFSSFFQVIRSKEFTENQLEMYNEARFILSKMTEDLSMAFPRGVVYPTTEASDFPFFISGGGEGKSSLRFTAFTHHPGPGSRTSDQAELFYFLAPNPENGLFYLMRSENPSIGIENTGIEYAISERVVAFSASFFSEDAEGHMVDEWDSTLRGTLPRGVEIGVVLMGPGGEEVEFSLFVIIPAAN
ncbi:MAG: prepilin-type N-terminal cleavage/methylation domain-containing protein [Candidatus Dadabacteria bacterium]|nr:prepilin-type N-terminal cleavage/methylation domain-containing protein [Candidatus Dadabacteria bacterium]